MISKQKLKEQIDTFPDEFSIDELVERLILIQKIENGMKQSDNDQIISEEELDKRIAKW